jgi:hypothetical protein
VTNSGKNAVLFIIGILIACYSPASGAILAIPLAGSYTFIRFKRFSGKTETKKYKKIFLPAGIVLFLLVLLFLPVYQQILDYASSDSARAYQQHWIKTEPGSAFPWAEWFHLIGLIFGEGLGRLLFLGLLFLGFIYSVRGEKKSLGISAGFLFLFFAGFLAIRGQIVPSRLFLCLLAPLLLAFGQGLENLKRSKKGVLYLPLALLALLSFSFANKDIWEKITADPNRYASDWIEGDDWTATAKWPEIFETVQKHQEKRPIVFEKQNCLNHQLAVPYYINRYDLFKPAPGQIKAVDTLFEKGGVLKLFLVRPTDFNPNAVKSRENFGRTWQKQAEKTFGRNYSETKLFPELENWCRLSEVKIKIPALWKKQKLPVFRERFPMPLLELNVKKEDENAYLLTGVDISPQILFSAKNQHIAKKSGIALLVSDIETGENTDIQISWQTGPLLRDKKGATALVNILGKKAKSSQDFCMPFIQKDSGTSSRIRLKKEYKERVFVSLMIGKTKNSWHTWTWIAFKKGDILNPGLYYAMGNQKKIHYKIKIIDWKLSYQ